MDRWSKTLSFVAFIVAINSAVCAADVDKAWPTRHVRIIVPFAAGSVIDLSARLYADGLTKRWGQPVAVPARQPGCLFNTQLCRRLCPHTAGQHSAPRITPGVISWLPEFDEAVE
jgi:hypothetical protein